jgi:hypothetical protein
VVRLLEAIGPETRLDLASHLAPEVGLKIYKFQLQFRFLYRKYEYSILSDEQYLVV